MGNSKRKVSPAIFGIIIICFFLPFVTVSCQNQDIATLSQFQLATGTTVENESIDPSPLAIIALLTAIIGLIIGFAKNAFYTVLSSAAGGIGLISTLWLKFTIDNKIMEQGDYMFHVKYGIGFYSIIILFFIAMCLNIYLFTQNKPRSSPSFASSGPEGPSFSPAPQNKFCSECGAKNDLADEFCRECGTKF